MYGMLTVDLHKDTTREQRGAFYDVLNRENWTKLPKVTTTWYASFKSTVTESEAIRVTKSDIQTAKRESGVKSVDAVIGVTDSKPELFSY